MPSTGKGLFHSDESSENNASDDKKDEAETCKYEGKYVNMFQTISKYFWNNCTSNATNSNLPGQNAFSYVIDLISGNLIDCFLCSVTINNNKGDD